MKDNKETMWIVFPFHCGVYSHENFKHATKEMEETQLKNFLEILNRRFDPNDTAKNITMQENLRQFTNEPNKFDDLFESAFDYEKVEKEATMQFSPK